MILVSFIFYQAIVERLAQALKWIEAKCTDVIWPRGLAPGDEIILIKDVLLCFETIYW